MHQRRGPANIEEFVVTEFTDTPVTPTPTKRNHCFAH